MNAALAEKEKNCKKETTEKINLNKSNLITTTSSYCRDVSLCKCYSFSMKYDERMKFNDMAFIHSVNARTIYGLHVISVQMGSFH